jgi:hypothetical protein
MLAKRDGTLGKTGPYFTGHKWLEAATVKGICLYNGPLERMLLVKSKRRQGFFLYRHFNKLRDKIF